MPLHRSFARRPILRAAALGAVHAASASMVRAAPAGGTRFVSRRPPIAARRFVSAAVDAEISRVKGAIADPELAWLFENCYPNTLDTTVRVSTFEGRPDTFVITGDIDAMWLRDSTAQVWPYLPLAKHDPALRALIAGLVHRQTRCVLVDPYANAFNFDGTHTSHWASDDTAMRNELHERKWEIDSLCYVVRLAHGYVTTTGDSSVLDERWRQAMAVIVRTFREQQRKTGRGPYKFQRKTKNPTDTLTAGGLGAPTRPVGLIHSGFRPSDDACTYPFLVPSNLFAVTSLRQLATLAEGVGAAPLAQEARALADEVAAALAAHAEAVHPQAGRIWAYEVDGFGNALFMDDANVPSLLALPYLGVCSIDDALYQRTRAFVLSDANPYFSRGKAADGIGGPHVGVGMIWPMSLIMRALTSRDEREIATCLRWLKGTHAGTGFMHESFWKDDPAHFTRPWFAWANTLFGELVVSIARDRPALLRRSVV